MNVLVVIATYKEANAIPAYLLHNLQGWLRQDCDANIDVIISDSISSPSFDRETRKFCVENSNDKIKFHYISNKSHDTLFVSINLGFRFMKDKYYDYYVYCSDDTELSKPNDLSKILQVFDRQPDAGIVSARVNIDNAALCHPYNNDKGDGSDLKIRLGESVNLHLMCFSRYFMEQYGFKYPDVLVSYATETLLTFFAKAIRKEWYLCRRVKVKNLKHMKRLPKHLRRPGHKKKNIGITGYGIYKNFATFDQLFKDGVSRGLGFETWRRIQKKSDEKRSPNPYWYMPDMNCYEGDQCKDPERLKAYILDNMYVPNSILDYDKLMKQIIEGN